MIKVECVSCKAPYELDERRIPEKGMKMRCPKCGTSFNVTRQGVAGEGAAALASAPIAAPPPIAPPPAAAAPIAPPLGGAIPKGTMLGHAVPPPAASAPIARPPAVAAPAAVPKPIAIPIAPPAPAASPAPAAATPARPPMGTIVGIAPALGDAKKSEPASPAAPAARGVFGAGAAPKPAASAPAMPPAMALESEVDLPAPRGAAPKPVLPSIDVSDLSVSNIRVDQLPVPKREVDLPRPQASMPPAASRADLDADLPAPKMQQPQPLHGHTDLPARKDKPTGAPGFGEISDLPATKSAKATAIAAPFAAPAGFDDLPALKSDADLPAPKGGGGFEFGDLDLPAPKANADLPAPKADFGAIDLPGLRGGADLPAPKPGGVRFGEIDLPTPKSSAVDLPTPKAGAIDLPMPKAGGMDLPTRKANPTDLPVPKGMADLPAPTNDLPTPRGDDESFADVMLDMPDLASDEHTTPDDVFGDIELPPPKPAADMVVPRERTIQGQARRAPTMQRQASAAIDNSTQGPDSELPPSLLGGDESSFDDLNLDDGLALSAPPPAAPAKRAAPTGPQATSLPPSLGGGMQDDLIDEDLVDEEEEYEEGDDFGEEEFEGGEEETDQEMEFGISGEDGDRASLAPDALRRQRGEDFEARQDALRKRTVTIVVRLAAVLVLLTAGAAALVFTEYGIFGVYYWEQWLPEAGDAEFARSAIQKAEKIAATDTYADAQRALKELGAARNKAGINRMLLSRGLLHESLFIVRFGDDPGSAARAAAILKRLEERSGNAPEMELARAADAARRKAYPEAQGFLATARSQGPTDPYVELLAGEIALAQNQLDPAEKAFAQALKLGGAARAQWGLARVALAKTDKEAQVAAVNETLKLSPMHVDARIAEGQIVWAQGKEERGLHLLQVAIGLEPTEEDRYLWSSKRSRATGYSVLGFVHESRGRLHLARDAYEQALKADAYRVEALLGSGRVLLRDKRPNDALPRFESALSSATKGGVNPIVLSGRHADAEASFGIARVMLALNRAAEAKAKLLELSNALPDDAEVLLALGETEQDLGNKDKAEEYLRRSIALAPTRFDGYLALSQLFFVQNDPAKASEVLNDAAAHVEETAHMRRKLAESELARGKLDSAAHEFKRALELDPYDIEAQFGLAIALRRRGDLAEATAAFEAIAKRDPNFAGLAEQRGLLLEARGEYEAAIGAYQGALEKDPSDMKLVLRLGAAQVLAGKLDEAEQTLAKVIREMPNSAEAEYFIGRIAFARGRTPDALANFDRAISLDNMKGEYHLYVARASFEMNNFGRALEEVDVALSRDPSLGDAYWVRAMVRLRQGAVKDALKDLDKALKLNPARIEAYAVQGDCYEQLRQQADAIRAYQTALQHDPKRGQWWYRLANLHADAGNAGEAEGAVRRAVELGETSDPMPWWFPDSLRMAGELAESSNNKQAAIRAYKRYVEVAQKSAIDYPMIVKKLATWGVELDEDN